MSVPIEPKDEEGDSAVTLDEEEEGTEVEQKVEEEEEVGDEEPHDAVGEWEDGCDAKCLKEELR